MPGLFIHSASTNHLVYLEPQGKDETQEMYKFKFPVLQLWSKSTALLENALGEIQGLEHRGNASPEPPRSQ